MRTQMFHLDCWLIIEWILYGDGQYSGAREAYFDVYSSMNCTSNIYLWGNLWFKNTKMFEHFRSFELQIGLEFPKRYCTRQLYCLPPLRNESDGVRTPFPLSFPRLLISERSIILTINFLGVKLKNFFLALRRQNEVSFREDQYSWRVR